MYLENSIHRYFFLHHFYPLFTPSNSLHAPPLKFTASSLILFIYEHVMGSLNVAPMCLCLWMTLGLNNLPADSHLEKPDSFSINCL